MRLGKRMLSQTDRDSNVKLFTANKKIAILETFWGYHITRERLTAIEAFR